MANARHGGLVGCSVHASEETMIYVVMAKRDETITEELRRTDKRVAYEDVALLREIVHLNCWVEERS